MERYRNTGGDSGIYGYEISQDSIKVQFTDGAMYLYNYASAGDYNIEQMKILAIGGSKLNSFINRNVRRRYATRLR